METIRQPEKNKQTQKPLIFKNLCGRIRLTTVQHKGQNHHIRSRASNRKTTSNEMSTMVPSNYGGKHNISISGHVKRKQNLGRRRGKKQKSKYSQPPLMDRHNRGDLREEGQKKRRKTTELRGNRKLEKNKQNKVKG